MTLQSRLRQTIKHSGRIRDAPLFTRRSAGRRWPFEDTTNDAPKYRILEGQDSYRLSSFQFNPFVNYPDAERGAPWLSTHIASSPQDQETFNFWTINSLPRAHNRREILRVGNRPGHNTESSMTLDEAVGGAEAAPNSAAPAWLMGPRASNQTSSPSTWPFESYRLDSIQTAMVKEVIGKLSNETLSQQELANDLQRIGQATLLRWGLPLAFVDAAANQQDVIGVGLDTLISTLPHSRDNNTWAGTLVGVLEDYHMLQLIDRTCLACLHHNIYHTKPKTRDSEARTQKRSWLEAIERVQAQRNAKRIDVEEWRIQTRRFRLQLAMARETGIMPSEAEYTEFMKSCQRAGQVRELELTFNHYLDNHQNARQQQMLQRQPGDPAGADHPSERIYREYIKGLVRQGRMDHAQEVFNSMKRRGLTPSIVIFGVMIDGYGRDMDLRKMRQMLKALNASGLLPTVTIYTSLIANYIRAGALQRADEVYRQMVVRADLNMDKQSRNVVENLLRLGGGRGVIPIDTQATVDAKTVQKADDTILANPGMERPNRVMHFNHKLRRYADAVNMSRVVTLYKRLVKEGLRPNSTTYNIVLDALVMSGQLKDGLQLLEHMKKSEEGQPDAVTFSTLIHGAVQEEKVDLGWSLYNEMRSRSIDPSLHTYVSLFELVALDPTNKRGRSIVKQYGFPGDHRVRFPVKAPVEDLVGLNFASELYNQLCNQGLQPNEHVFCSLLNMAARGGFMDLAQHVYLEMAYKNVEPNTAIMTTLIKGFAIRRDFESGWKVWKHMVETNIPRNAITYQHLVRLCERSLPNPIVTAEILDGPSSHKVDKEDLQTSKKAGRPKLMKEMTKEQRLPQGKEALAAQGESRKESLENTSRIPLEILTEIRDQMSVDRVHWSRVLQFRKRAIDRSIWAPIASEVGPVMAASEALASGNSRFSARDSPFRSSDLVSTTNTRIYDADTEAGLSPAPVVCKEIYTGGGDMYVPRRAPRKATLLRWNADDKTPILMKDHKRAAATDEEKDRYSDDEVRSNVSRSSQTSRAFENDEGCSHAVSSS
ncbi:Pentatricopeptide repeat-containing protein 1, mitochondrial [Dissophora ornata]|nr:Pentatricopeptide repeat-containing protein 1, mitochondrial [Dissophora ornata]